MKIYMVLAMMVFLAGCVSNGTSDTTHTDDKNLETKTVYGEELNIGIDELPSEISVENTEYFKLVTEAETSVQNVRVLVYNLGSYLKSSCEGSNSLKDVSGGEIKEVSCSLNVIEEPIENVEQEIFYEATYKVKQYEGQVSLKVYDADEFERVNPDTDGKSVDIGVGTLKIDSTSVKEGEEAEITIDLDGDFSTGDCGCNIEKAIVKIPQGFTVNGFFGWTRYSCGSFNCFERRNIDTPLNSKGYVSIGGVVRTDTFYISTEIQGVWKLSRGSKTVEILS